MPIREYAIPVSLWHVLCQERRRPRARYGGDAVAGGGWVQVDAVHVITLRSMGIMAYSRCHVVEFFIDKIRWPWFRMSVLSPNS